jgi:RND family efflux transporter MFP subunit
VHTEWVATLDGYVNAEIRPQVSGYIVSQDYKEGEVVRKGQVLFEIDPRPFQATLDRAKGELAQAKAQLGKSIIDVERDTPLAEQKAVPKEKLDNEIQAKLAAEAAVASGEAAVERAELDLGWTKVTSLVDGIAGIAEIQMGNLVGPAIRLTSVSQVDPIKVYFPVSEQEYLRAKHLSSSAQPTKRRSSAASTTASTVASRKCRAPRRCSPNVNSDSIELAVSRARSVIQGGIETARAATSPAVSELTSATTVCAPASRNIRACRTSIVSPPSSTSGLGRSCTAPRSRSPRPAAIIAPRIAAPLGPPTI